MGSRGYVELDLWVSESSKPLCSHVREGDTTEHVGTVTLVVSLRPGRAFLLRHGARSLLRKIVLGFYPVPLVQVGSEGNLSASSMAAVVTNMHCRACNGGIRGRGRKPTCALCRDKTVDGSYYVQEDDDGQVQTFCLVCSLVMQHQVWLTRSST